MKYIIKLSSEITVKSKPVRKRCITMLKNNIKKHFDYNNIPIWISGHWDVINVEYNKKIDSIESKREIHNQIISLLSKISGISFFMEVSTFSLENCISKSEIFDTIFKETKDIHLQSITWRSFAVRVKRSWVHAFTSTDIERYVWGGLLQFWENCRVQLKNPEITIQLEIRDKKFHVIRHTMKWMDGYPVWFQEKVLSLISGGFDSGVSTQAMMKRGCKIDYLFFNLWWSAHALWVKQVSHYLWKNFSVSYKKARFITIPFENIIEQLLTQVHHKYRWILLKRYMLQVASRIAENHYYALVKWDSLGQVSSQTLKNMHVIDKASDTLILRPLIANNKQEIINMSWGIGTYHFACNMPEYCWIIADKPSTGAKLEKILAEEENIPQTVLDEAYENRKIEFVKDIPLNNAQSEQKDIELVSELWKDEILIDIREPVKILKNNDLAEYKKENKVLEIPFFHINAQFPKLDSQINYLFYCDKWILSELHWLYLQEKWHSNIKVFRPQIEGL